VDGLGPLMPAFLPGTAPIATPDEIVHFERDMRNRRVVKLDATDHNRFLHDEKPRSIVVNEMRAFLLNEGN